MAEAPSDTPVHDDVKKDLEEAQEEDLTHFGEDDDPLQFAGEFLEPEDEADAKMGEEEE